MRLVGRSGLAWLGRIVGDAGGAERVAGLEDGAALLISVAKYFTPSGKQIENSEPQEAGIKPTVEIRQTVEEAVDLDDEIKAPPKEPIKEEDRQLNKAIEILKDPSKITAAKKAA